MSKLINFDKTFLSKINSLYRELNNKRDEIKKVLFNMNFSITDAFFNGHYSKDTNGNWEFEHFPIPVISVLNLCDVEIGFEGITITSKLKREHATVFDYGKLIDYDFEVYGVIDYLTDFYNSNTKVGDIITNILKSNEEEIFISLYLQDESEITKILLLLDENNFYY